MYQTPILFLIFNRPDLTKQVFEKIRAVKPEYLYVSADGPRVHKSEDVYLCAQTRQIVQEGIDWPCKVKYLFRNENLGCGLAVSGAIDWFFSQVEEGIILEDDTLPDLSFFQFSETLLERYRHSPEVLHISGNNFQFGRIRGNGAYYGSRFAHSWGWATWRRAWNKYDINMPDFPAIWDQSVLKCNLPSEIANWWKHNLLLAKEGKCNTWDYQWHYCIMKHQGICLIPNLNLVENIGIGVDATHMQMKNIASSIRKKCLLWYGAPDALSICQKADEFDFEYALKNKKPTHFSFSEYFQNLKFEFYVNRTR